MEQAVTPALGYLPLGREIMLYLAKNIQHCYFVFSFLLKQNVMLIDSRTKSETVLQAIIVLPLGSL